MQILKTLKTKLLILSGSALLLIGILAYDTIIELDHVQAIVTNKLNKDGRLSVLTSEITANSLQLRRFEKDMFLNIDKKNKVASYEKKWIKKIAELNTKINDAVAIAEDDKNRMQLKETGTNLAKYVAGMKGIIVNIKAGKIKTPQAGNKAVGPFKNYVRSIGNLHKYYEDRMMAVTSDVTNTLKSLYTELIVISGITVLVMLSLAFFLGRSILNQLGAEPVVLAGISNRIASGDLQKSEEESEQTRGISANLTEMREKISKMIRSIKVASVEITAGSRHLSESSENLSQNSTEQSSAIEQVSAAITQLSSQSKVSLENAERTNERTKSTYEQAVHGQKLMATMTDSMTAIEQASNDISNIIQVIDDLSFQTKLLALNAAVEAARAGEHGRGFAVVAEEVKSLSSQSAEAAKDTGVIIKEALTKIEDGVGSVKETEAALNQIIQGVEDVSPMIDEITKATNEQMSGIAHINQGIQQIEISVQQNAANAEENAATSEELLEQSVSLNSIVSFFKFEDDAEHSAVITQKIQNQMTKIALTPQENLQHSKSNGNGNGNGNGAKKDTDKVLALDSEDYGVFG